VQPRPDPFPATVRPAPPSRAVEERGAHGPDLRSVHPRTTRSTARRWRGGMPQLDPGYRQWQTKDGHMENRPIYDDPFNVWIWTTRSITC
jgi:hypothetical protein